MEYRLSDLHQEEVGVHIGRLRPPEIASLSYGASWESLDDVGLKMLMTEFALDYTETASAKSTLDKSLS